MPAWMQKAIGEIGQKEIVGKKHNPRILEYQSKTGLNATDDETPWCGSFVAWCFDQTGIDYRKVRNVAAGARQWLNWGRDVSKEGPFYGCLMVLRRTGSPTAGHVTFFVEWVDEAKGLFRGLGGNQSNSVSIATYSTQDLLGIRWPEEIPLPTSQQRLRDSGVVRWSLFGSAGAVTVLLDSANEIVGALNEADGQLSTGSVIGAIAAGIIIAALIGVLISRIRGQKAEQKIEEGLN